MDLDLTAQIRRCACGAPLDLDRALAPDEARRGEWTGTGLCAEAQADGVPCPTPADACDRCGRALRDPATPEPVR